MESTDAKIAQARRERMNDRLVLARRTRSTALELAKSARITSLLAQAAFESADAALGDLVAEQIRQDAP